MRHLDRDNEHKNLKYYVQYYDSYIINSEKEVASTQRKKEISSTQRKKEKLHQQNKEFCVIDINNDLFLQFPL
jgi:hypothetical protein